MDRELQILRDEIARLDRALLELLERRFDRAARVGELKAEAGRPIVVREVEQRVLGRAREAAEGCGVSPEVMEAIFGAVIRGAVERQHRVGVARGARGGARVVVLGAAGAMGGWLRRFLEGIGHAPDGVDPAWKELPPAEGRYAALEEVPRLEEADALFVSVPLGRTAEVLERLASGRVPLPPVVVEIASIKTPLEPALRALGRKGAQALSLHPMFGPSKNPYEPLNVVHAVLEDEAAEREAALGLLAHPYLDLVSMPFAAHDRLMGWLLGLAHLTSMLFAGALGRSGLAPGDLERTASTTFRRQVSTARSVLDEDPDLYFEIQRMNPFRGEVYDALRTALEHLTSAVDRDDRAAFTDLLGRAGGALPRC